MNLDICIEGVLLCGHKCRQISTVYIRKIVVIKYKRWIKITNGIERI